MRSASYIALCRSATVPSTSSRIVLGLFNARLPVSRDVLLVGILHFDAATEPVTVLGGPLLVLLDVDVVVLERVDGLFEHADEHTQRLHAEGHRGVAEAVIILSQERLSTELLVARTLRR